MTALSTLKTHSFKLATGGVLVFSLVATGCQSSIESNTTVANQTKSGTSTPATSDVSQQTLRQQALRIQQALANNDYASITNDIHPTRGIRFSMYTHVRPESDKIFSRAQFAQYLKESRIRFTWGELDGTGDPLVLPLPEYLATWVNGKTFNDANISINEVNDNGNRINNIRNIYQNSDVVEFYHKGSDEYAGMDWRALRLVFDDYQGKRYLVAIINNQWTI